jgi:choline dehydrogenase-like flavoprotein
VQLGGRIVPHPRGKVVGGSTALNFLIFNRAAKDEYDSWAEIGNDGWDGASFLPSFQSSYNWTAMIQGEEFPGGLNATDANPLDQAYVGSGGVIQVRLSFWHRTTRTHTAHAFQASYNSYYTDLSDPYVRAMNSLNVSTNSIPVRMPIDSLPSYDWHVSIKDSGNQTGIYNSPSSVDRTTGKRSYAAAYYTKNLDNTNFVVLTGAQATKINFSPNKRDGNIVATGIDFQINGTTYVVNVTKEVILSAGVFQSPQYVIWPMWFMLRALMLLQAPRAQWYREFHDPPGSWYFPYRTSLL